MTEYEYRVSWFVMGNRKKTELVFPSLAEAKSFVDSHLLGVDEVSDVQINRTRLDDDPASVFRISSEERRNICDFLSGLSQIIDQIESMPVDAQVEMVERYMRAHSVSAAWPAISKIAVLSPAVANLLARHHRLAAEHGTDPGPSH
jgi:hypothetical protein